MNHNEKSLFNLCKKGDLNKVKNLIEIEDVDLNLRDKWDSTPLYYACLCGHIELVQYLLSNGARCDANTFDGERCQYGALTDQIRNVLRTFKVNTSKLDQYDFFLERLYELAAYSDFYFDIKGRVFKAHKIILATRSNYFKNKFETKWKCKDSVIGTHELLEPEAFGSVLKYLYTGRFSTHRMHLIACLNVIKSFKLKDLKHRLETKYDYLLNELKEKEAEYNERESFYAGKFGANSRISNILIIEPEVSIIGLDFKKLVDDIVCHQNQSSENSLTSIIETTHDLSLRIENDNMIKAHKAFLAERCDYFKTFLHDPFSENKDQMMTGREISQIGLNDISKEALKEIIYFIYSNNFSTKIVDEDLLYEVLVFSDMYLLPSLKRKCAGELVTQRLNEENVFDLLNLARLYDLKKLEFTCVSFLAANLLEIRNSEKLKEIILKDAAQLKLRQETDTIDIIDDLRYAINEVDSALLLNNVYSSESAESKSKLVDKKDSFQLLVDREKKLELLEAILHELGLEC